MDWLSYGIDISKVSGGKTFCPKCHDTRKNKRDRSLSVDLETGLFNCHNGCGFKGVVKKEKKVYVKPPSRLTKLSEKLIAWFESRSISNNTLLRFKVTESQEWMPQFEKEVPVVCFNYYRGEDLVNIKFRGPQKSFKMVKDAELIFYNIDAVDEEVIIVEGEIDAMSFYEAGVHNVISVPNGASLGSMKLEYLDNCWGNFKNCKKIIIATDNDEPGIALREELARRLGKERCYQVDFVDTKDANEYLVKYGKESLKSLAKSPISWPLEGIKTMDDMFDTIEDYYINGYPPGADTGIPSLDELITFAPGLLTIITGIPSSGKDEFLNLIIARLSERHKWSFGVCGMEEEPAFHVTKMIEKYTGKAFAFRKDPSHRVTEQEKNYGIKMTDLYISYIDIDQVEVTVDSILAKASELVLRKGIRGLVINPWNCLEHSRPASLSETEYTGKVLGQITSWSRKHSVHTFLIAHPTKIKKTDGKNYDVPTLYSISGSAHFYNKTHNGFVVYRDFANGGSEVKIIVQKVKWSWQGKLGECSFYFNTNTRQYEMI